MKRTLAMLTLLLVLFVLVGCKGTKIDANAFNGVMEPVLERHDFYVTNDDSLSDAERESFLRSSALMRSIVETAEGS